MGFTSVYCQCTGHQSENAHTARFITERVKPKLGVMVRLLEQGLSMAMTRKHNSIGMYPEH